MRTMALSTRRRGMTLPELIVAMAIAGLLTAIALPSIRRSLRRYSVEQATEKFSADLAEAQTRAIKLNRSVTVQRIGLSTYRIDGGDTRSLPTSVSFTADAPDSVRFVSFGPPTTGAVAFTLQWDTNRDTVNVNAAGRITR